MSIGVPPHPTVPGTKPAFLRRRIRRCCRLRYSTARIAPRYRSQAVPAALGISTIHCVFGLPTHVRSYPLAGDRRHQAHGFLQHLPALVIALTSALSASSGGAAVAMLFVCRLLVGAAEAPSFPVMPFDLCLRPERAGVFDLRRGTIFRHGRFHPAHSLAGIALASHSAFFVMGALGLLLAFAWQKAVCAVSKPSVKAATPIRIREGRRGPGRSGGRGLAGAAAGQNLGLYQGIAEQS